MTRNSGAIVNATVKTTVKSNIQSSAKRASAPLGKRSSSDVKSSALQTNSYSAGDSSVNKLTARSSGSNSTLNSCGMFAVGFLGTGAFSGLGIQTIGLSGTSLAADITLIALTVAFLGKLIADFIRGGRNSLPSNSDLYKVSWEEEPAWQRISVPKLSLARQCVRRK